MKSPTALPWILLITSVSCAAQTLVIGLYDYSNLSAQETLRLSEVGSAVLAHAGIHVVFQNCRGALSSPGNGCEKELEANEILVRLVSHAASGPNDNKTSHMANALVTAAGGNTVSLFVPAVRAQAAEFGVAFDLLLGYALAHEVGHCLLGPKHSYVGLMRGSWTRKDADEMSRLGLDLTRQEARRAVARLRYLNGSVRK